MTTHTRFSIQQEFKMQYPEYIQYDNKTWELVDESDGTYFHHYTFTDDCGDIRQGLDPAIFAWENNRWACFPL